MYDTPALFAPRMKLRPLTEEQQAYGDRLDALNYKVAALRQQGHDVEQQDIPGLWRVDNGPELTTNQLLGL